MKTKNTPQGKRITRHGRAPDLPLSTLKLALAAAILSAAAPIAAYGAPGDIASGGGQGGKGGDSTNGNGGGGGAGGLAGGGGGGGGGQGGVIPATPVAGGGGGSGAPLGGGAGPGANGGNSSSAGGLGGLVLGGDASSGGGGGGGAGGIAAAGGAGGNSLTPPGNVSASLNTVLSSAMAGMDGDDGSAGSFDAGGGGGSGGQGGLVLTGPNAVLSTGGTSVSGGNGGDGATAAGGAGGGGGGGGGAAAVVLVSGGIIRHDGSVIIGGTGGAAGLGPDSGGGGGGAGVFLVDGGTLFNNVGTVQGGLGGAATSGAGGQGGAAVLANRGAVNNAASIRGGNGAGAAAAGAGGDAIVANGTAIANDAGGQIIGGRGGDGFGSSGQPGNGGVGVRFINTGGSLQNAGTISGGAAGSPSGATRGAGVIAQGGVTLTNSGTIVGGMGSFSGIRVNAVELSGGANRLTLQAGSTLLGNVVSTSGTTLGGDILALGGDTTDASTTFNVGQIGAVGATVQYQGFNSYEKTGASTWTLTGSNAGVTPWTLSAGTLVVGADAALGNVAGTLTFNGGTLRNTGAIDTARAIVVSAGGGTLDTPQPVTLQGTLSGSGALTKTGAATLTLNGASSYTGAFALQAGKLVVGDATHAGAVLPGIVTVANGATLGGQGTVGGAVIGAGGIVAPGNSIGTLHVTGDFTMAPGAAYQVEVDSASSASDRIVVGGTATLAGSVVHVGPDGNFSLARDYTIVTAAGGLQGAFNSVASHYAFLDPKLSYGANDVTLRMQLKQVPGDGGSGNGGDGGNGGGGGTRPIRFADAAETGNQRAVANAVQSMSQDNAVYSQVLNLPVGAPPAAFDALSGEIHPSTIAALHGVGDTVASLPMAHLRANLYAGQTAGAPTAQAGSAALGAIAMPRPAAQPLWAEVFGSWRTLDGNGNAGRVRQSDGGLFVGGDRAVGAGWRLGGALGYTGSHVSLRDRASTADVDSYSATLYGGKAFQAGPGHIEWTAGTAYTWHDIDTRRDTSAAGLADTLKASYHAGTAQVFTELGYRLPVGDGMAVQPFAGVNYSDLRVRGFSESGGVAALDGESERSAVTTTTLGLRGELRFESAGMPGRVHAMAGWRHAFGDLDPTTTMAFGDSVPFTVAGAPIAQDAAVMELGIDMRLTKSTSVGVAYNGQFGGGNRQNAGSVNVAWRF